jgi:tripartite-type tricarboxylate transporter receptor subunit TctC
MNRRLVLGPSVAGLAAPDGYTWLLACDNEATSQTVMRLPCRTLTDFAPVTLVAQGPLALATHHTTPFRSVADLIEAARWQPDHFAYATSGAGGLAHGSTTLLSQQAGIRLVHVPYRGGGPAVQDAVAGTVPLFMSNVVIISQHIAAGTLRPLGVITRGESRHVQGVRSFAQQGLGDFEAPPWRAFLGRAGTPPPILDRMHAALTSVLPEPAVKERIEAPGLRHRRRQPRPGPALAGRRDREMGAGEPRQQHHRRQLTARGRA